MDASRREFTVSLPMGDPLATTNLTALEFQGSKTVQSSLTYSTVYFMLLYPEGHTALGVFQHEESPMRSQASTGRRWRARDGDMGMYGWEIFTEVQSTPGCMTLAG